MIISKITCCHVPESRTCHTVHWRDTVSTSGGIMSTSGDIMSISGDVQYIGGYHDYIGDVQYVEVFNRN